MNPRLAHARLNAPPCLTLAAAAVGRPCDPIEHPPLHRCEAWFLHLTQSPRTLDREPPGYPRHAIPRVQCGYQLCGKLTLHVPAYLRVNGPSDTDRMPGCHVGKLRHSAHCLLNETLTCLDRLISDKNCQCGTFMPHTPYVELPQSASCVPILHYSPWQVVTLVNSLVTRASFHKLPWPVSCICHTNHTYVE